MAEVFATSPVATRAGQLHAWRLALAELTDRKDMVPVWVVELHRRFYIERPFVAQQRGFFLRDQLVVVFLTRADDLAKGQV